MIIMAEIGEYAKGRHVELTPVEYAGTITAGDPLKVSGVASDGTTRLLRPHGLMRLGSLLCRMAGACLVMSRMS